MNIAQHLKLLCAFFWIIFCSNSYAQQPRHRVIRTYFDPEKKKNIREEYRVLESDSTLLDGLYKTYYENGRVKTVGFYTRGQATDYWEYFYENGNLRMEGLINNFLQEGFWIFYHENGTKSMEGNMTKGKKNGYWRFYNEEGKLKSEGLLREGRNEGEWKYYYDEGLVKATGSFKDGIGYYNEFYPTGQLKMEGKIKNGKSDSTWKYYHPNGKLKAVGIETNGQKEGLWRFYNENGVLASEGTYKNGKTNGFWKYYDEQGKLSAQGVETDGQREGEWRMFYPNGKIKGKGIFAYGDGPYEEYYENGALKIKGAIRKGSFDGLWEFFYEDGSLEGTCTYLNGEGWYTGYYPDKTKKMEGMLREGSKIGVWKLYKKDGKIAGYYKTYYEDEESKPANASVGKPQEVQVIKLKGVSVKAPKVKKPRLRLYRPDPNVYKTFILSYDPIQLLSNGYALSLEYYVQEKWGVEATLIHFRGPLFENPENLNFYKIYQIGNGYSIRYKRYFTNEEFIGRPYIGGEIRLGDRNFYARIPDSTISATKSRIAGVNDRNVETIVLFGDRFMRDFAKRGFTLDLILGIGVGYTHVTPNFNSSDRFVGETFKEYTNRTFYLAYRFGVSIGYAF